MKSYCLSLQSLSIHLSPSAFNDEATNCFRLLDAISLHSINDFRKNICMLLGMHWDSENVTHSNTPTQYIHNIDTTIDCHRSIQSDSYQNKPDKPFSFFFPPTFFTNESNEITISITISCFIYTRRSCAISQNIPISSHSSPHPHSPVLQSTHISSGSTFIDCNSSLILKPKNLNSAISRSSLSISLLIPLPPYIVHNTLQHNTCHDAKYCMPYTSNKDQSPSSSSSYLALEGFAYSILLNIIEFWRFNVQKHPPKQVCLCFRR